MDLLAYVIGSDVTHISMRKVVQPVMVGIPGKYKAMDHSVLLIPALYSSCSGVAVTGCKCLPVSLTELHMTTPSPEPSNSERSEGTQDREMAAEPECSGSGGCRVAGEDIAVCQSSAAPEAPTSTVNSASQNARNTHSQSGVAATNLTLQLSETAVANTAVGTENDPDSQLVSVDDSSDEITRKIFSLMPFSEKQFEVAVSDAADYTLSSCGSTGDLSDGILLNLFSDMSLGEQQSETAASDGTVCDCDPDSWRVSADNLPDEILVKIFSHMSFSELVDVVPKVSPRWRRLSQDMELWADKEYHVRYSSGYESDTCKYGMTDEEAIQTFHDVPNLRKVCMWRGVRSCVFRELYSRCHRLEELRVSGNQKLSYSVLKNLVQKCSRIHTLAISNELLKSEQFSEAVSHLQHLHVLDLDEHYTGSTPVLTPLGKGCPRLADVNFGYTTVDMDDLRHFLNAKRKTLKTIRIKWAMAGRRCVLPLLTVCADTLERLELCEFDMVRDEAREAFTALGSLKNLQELRMQVTDPLPRGTAALAFKTGGLPKLRLLELREGHGLDDDAVIAISRGCPALRELCLRQASRLSDAAFSQIHRLKHLEILDVSACSGLGRALIPCLARLPRLHTLVMEELEFPKLQPGLDSIVELSGVRCLTLDSSLITGVPFDKFPGKLVSLRELNILWCRGDPNATDGLAEQMPDLKINGRIEVEEPDEEDEDDEDMGDDENVMGFAEEEEEEEEEEDAGPGDAE